MVTATIGNLFESQAATLVNTVNCVGVMGKGVALEFKKRYPTMVRDYEARCRRGEVQLGQPYLYKELYGVEIINFPTKQHWRSPSRLADIASGLDYLVAQAGSWGLKSIAMPPLGCGNGGLDWADVGPLIYSKLNHLPIRVEVYAPYGTHAEQLTTEFLAGGGQSNPRERGRMQRGVDDGSVVLLETLRQLAIQPHAPPIGRTKYQKVAYALTVQGVPTGFTFSKGSYGPFSAEARDAVGRLANANLLEEEQRGPMMIMRSTLDFEDTKHRYRTVIDQHLKAIEATIDLFSRIHTTEQAEEVATTLFAYRSLAPSRPGGVAIDRLVAYVTEWKPHWSTIASKVASIRNSAVILGLLGWADRLIIPDDFDIFDEPSPSSSLGPSPI